MCIYIKANILSGYPRVLGHELCGVVADVGKGVRHFSIGQRVSQPTQIFFARDVLLASRINRTFARILLQSV